jgi:hypothetical protein
MMVVPARIGPVEFGELGGMVAVRCPHDFDHLMRKAGGQWEPGSRRWLIERRRIGLVIRALQRTTDPLFRRRGWTWTKADTWPLDWRARRLRSPQNLKTEANQGFIRLDFLVQPAAAGHPIRPH